MCITVGKLSLLDWPRLTWSLGWTGSRLPNGWPSISLARLAITSLAFMLVWVPDPVCQTGNGKSASRLPSAISPAAEMMGPDRSSGSSPSARLASAAASFCKPHGADQHRREVLRPDAEQPTGAFGLRAPVALGGDLDRAERVGLGAGLAGHGLPPCAERRNLVSGLACDACKLRRTHVACPMQQRRSDVTRPRTFVMPAKAGIHDFKRRDCWGMKSWMPALAGMTTGRYRSARTAGHTRPNLRHGRDKHGHDEE